MNGCQLSVDTFIINEELVSTETPFLMSLASKVGFLH